MLLKAGLATATLMADNIMERWPPCLLTIPIVTSSCTGSCMSVMKATSVLRASAVEDILMEETNRSLNASLLRETLTTMCFLIGKLTNATDTSLSNASQTAITWTEELNLGTLPLLQEGNLKEITTSSGVLSNFDIKT